MNQTNMTGREIVTRVIERKDAPRIGFNFNYPHQNDLRWQGIAGFENHYEQYSTWGRYPEIMATGNRELIEATAHNMIRVFKEYADGALIAKDYPTWDDIMVKQEWATWARDIFLQEGWNK